MLVEVVSKGGNLLLNVGPTARGTFDERAKERLEGIGAWMEGHSRSIYGCTQAPDEFKTPQNCLLTYNPTAKRLYVHVLEWPMGALFLDGFAGHVAYAQLLNDASEVKFIDQSRAGEIGFFTEERKGEKGNAIILRLPVPPPAVTVPVVELFLK
jgi:alpha-L-fucosidase